MCHRNEKGLSQYLCRNIYVQPLRIMSSGCHLSCDNLVPSPEVTWPQHYVSRGAGRQIYETECCSYFNDVTKQHTLKIHICILNLGEMFLLLPLGKWWCHHLNKTPGGGAFKWSNVLNIISKSVTGKSAGKRKGLKG